MPTERNIGLARALSKLGVCSRSRAFELIRSGRVHLNGSVQRDPEHPVKITRDRIEVDREPVGSTDFIYLLMNKPRGLVTTASDEKGRRTVYDLLDKDLPWLSPVGRLDKASEGLLIFTNDSEWAARITDPRSDLPKVYHVQIATVADEDLINSITAGVHSRGEHLAVLNGTCLRGGKSNSWLEITLDEGKNRHIRRIFEVLEIEVLRLVRVSIGPLILGDLPKSSTRLMTPREKRAIDSAIALAR